MKTLELIRRLYDEKVDAADLEDGLSEDELDELNRLVEARDAVELLPKSAPSPQVIDLVRSAAREASPNPRPRMSLILSTSFVQRFAAAAAIIAAVGLGFLTLKPSIPSSTTSLDESAPIVAENEQRAPEPDRAKRDELKEEYASKSGIPASPDEIVLLDDSAGSKLIDEYDADLASAERAAGAASRRSADETEKAGDSIGWDDDPRFQTFYWQVQALSQRSPYDDLEEAVPLEGSFEVLNRAKRDQGWLEANSEK